MVTSFQGRGRTFAVRASGIFDYQKTRGRIVVDLTDVARISGEPVKNPRAEVRYDGDVYYGRLPRGTKGAGALPLGRWFKIDLSRLGEKTRINLAALIQSDQDPVHLVQFLRAVTGDIERRGQETVRGANTTRYHGRVDLDKMLEVIAKKGDFPASARRQTQAEADKLKVEMGRSSFPVDVWLDHEGRPRRLRETFSFSGGKQILSVDLYDFGVPVRVVKPSNAVDITDLIPQ